MWMSGLAERSGMTVATIKYYLRVGLLPPGEVTGATRARYGEEHVRRLRLVRALADVGGLRLEQIRDVLAAVDDPAASLHDVMASAHSQLSSGPEPGDGSLTRVRRLVRRRRWRIADPSDHAAALARALDSLEAVGVHLPDAALDGYADTAATIAEREFAAFEVTSPTDAAERAVVLTVLVEPVLLSLRRLAHENLSARRFARRR